MKIDPGTAASARRAPIVMLLALAAQAAALGQSNLCDEPSKAPDVIVSDIGFPLRNGAVGGITAFSFPVLACNIGSCWLNWQGSTSEHPVIGQNMFRLKDGRFEHIGQAWLKHTFGVGQGLDCSPACNPGDGAHLGVNCSDGYLASASGNQARMGPKFEVNVATGVYPFPATGFGTTGDAIYKRLQVHDVDLDPTLNQGALYFAELQYVTRDDAASGRNHNNASYRQLSASGSPGNYHISVTGTTAPQKAGIEAWKASDPSVVQTDASVPGEGRFFVAARATLGGGLWHYEYAVQNLSSDRAARSFSVPIPAGTAVSNLGFHDVDYHSGEPYAGTDWSATLAQDSLTWTTDAYADDPNANALRWGTLYNFRFDADAPPALSAATLTLYRPGTPASIPVTTLVPTSCAGLDQDGDGYAACDCDDTSASLWAPPHEAQSLRFVKAGGVALSWSPPWTAGASSIVYDALRASDVLDFVGADCLSAADPASLTRYDLQNPPRGESFYYLVRARNACPNGAGSLGSGSSGVPRTGRTCP